MNSAITQTTAVQDTLRLSDKLKDIDANMEPI